jgi:hypothetical protein
MCEKCESEYSYEEHQVPKTPEKPVIVLRNAPDTLVLYPDLMEDRIYEVEWLGTNFKVQRIGQIIRLMYNNNSIEFDYFDLKLYEGIALRLDNKVLYASKPSLGVISIMLWKT